ncbi:hypothetical protein DYQ86_03320 [Acidobacteria bacterium AB60]|nr:hypothetical protein DYQ86_03320 [Acidobacteria bacterium AB60]
MIRILFRLTLLAVVTAGTALPAQNTGEIPGTKVRPAPREENVPTDPRLAGEGSLPLHVAVQPWASMGQAEKDLAARASASIREQAKLYELGFGEGAWQQSELDCPAFPQHMFLRFTRDRGAGDVSMFTASIPRGGQGRVRVIPILRSGYSVILPAPESKVTIAAFNQILGEEHLGAKPDWSAVSVCYAALTSERWKEAQSLVELVMVGSQTLQLQQHGALSVALELAEPAPGRWVIVYGGSARVVSTEYTPFGDLTWRPLLNPTPEVHGKPLPSPQTEVQGRPVPVGAAPSGKQVPAPSSGEAPKRQQ